jgi:hypothetical protein
MKIHKFSEIRSRVNQTNAEEIGRQQQAQVTYVPDRARSQIIEPTVIRKLLYRRFLEKFVPYFVP